MKQGNWDFYRIKCWLVAGLLGLLLILPALAMAQAVVKITRVDLSLSMRRYALSSHAVTLPYRWDTHFPGEGGAMHVRFALPNLQAEHSNTTLAMYIPRVGNQYAVYLNGTLISSGQPLTDRYHNAAKQPSLIEFPSVLLKPVGNNWIEMTIHAQASRWGGVSEIYYGTAHDIQPMYSAARHWQYTSYIVVLVFLFSGGIWAAYLWWMQREHLYALFAWSALLGIIASLDKLMMTALMPWPIQGWVAATALAWHVIFMTRFAMYAVGRHENWVTLSMVATALAAGIAYLLAEPIYWTIAYGMMCLPVVAALFATAHAVDKRQSEYAVLLLGASLVVTVVAMRDFFMVQGSESGMSEFLLLPHALFLYVLAMHWIVIRSYSVQHQQYHELNVTLEQRVQAREAQLRQSFEEIQVNRDEQAKLLERQRIMQDIHDGVGGQLVGLVNMMKRSDSLPAQLQEHAQMALDELRVAVDAMQPVEGDLTTVLATLRYRLEPRLKATGIELVWDVEALPMMLDLTPQKVLQIQKILLEAFTNIMRHSGARTVVVNARSKVATVHAIPHSIVLTIADDGVGFDATGTSSQGHGLGNMRFRAEAIGAHLSVARGLPQGTTMSLEIPL